MLTHIENIQQLGQVLREVREDRKLSLAEAAGQLHIRTLYLQALESGDWNALPGLAYGRGYLRRYAALIGLSQREVMEVCDRLQGKVSSRLNYLDIAGIEEAPSHGMIWLSLGTAAALLLGWYLWQDTGGTAERDYTMPESLAWRLRSSDGVTPSPHPAAAQECMKLLQEPRNPCYYVQAEQKMPMLAYQWLTTSDWWLAKYNQPL